MEKSNGHLEYLGRIDNQVKIRGFRIELGEIETVLSQHPDVSQAVVTISDNSDTTFLVAYIVFIANKTVSLDQLREYIKKKVPGYMIPSFFVVLDLLPLTISGKIDRKALPFPKELKPNISEEYVPPQTHTEELIAKLWSDLLNQEQASVNDNFFDSGGHSLLATQLISNVRNEFNVEIPLRTLFEQPTIEGFAKAVEQGQQKSSPIEPIEPI
jgi:acyl carrier protein